MSSSTSSSLGTADIVGIAVGGVLALVTVIGLIISCYTMCCKKNKSSPVTPYPQPNYQYNPQGQSMNTGYYPPQQYGPPDEQYYSRQPTNNVQQHPYYTPKSHH